MEMDHLLQDSESNDNWPGTANTFDSDNVPETRNNFDSFDFNTDVDHGSTYSEK